MLTMVPVCIVLPGRAQLIVRPGYHTAQKQPLGKYAPAELGFPADTLYFPVLSGHCKGILAMPVLVAKERQDSVRPEPRRAGKPGKVMVPPSKSPLFSIQGQVMYDYFYQSHTDTPYMQKDVHQHTVQTVLDVTWRDRYPFRIAFSTAQGNSDYFRNLTGLQFKYTNRDFRNQIIRKAGEWSAMQAKDLGKLVPLKDSIDYYRGALGRLRAWLADPGWQQRLVEWRERALKPGGNTSLPSARMPEWPKNRPFLNGKFTLPESGKIIKQAPEDSLRVLQASLEAARRRADSLQHKLTALEQVYNGRLANINGRRTRLLDALKTSRNNRELADHLSGMQLPDSILPKGYRALLAVRSVGIGRTMVDYSELTARNISITGVQLEYNPSWYLAAAAGRIDYRFRDFYSNSNRVRQHLQIIRGGYGMKDNNYIFLTFYTGKRQLYNFHTGEVPENNTAPDFRIMGISLQGRWKLDENHAITGEVAKSTVPYYARAATHGGNGGMLRFSERSNEAYAVSSASFIPVTATRITGMYKMMGRNFQSFSMYASGNTQHAWMVQAEQPFFRKQLTVTAGVRRNVFESTMEHADYHTSTVFTSIQATFRKKGLPVVTAGYFPSSQWMKIGEGRIVENLFYTLMGNVSHFYRLRDVSMSTMLSATRFYNRQADSNFVYFNSTQLSLSQAVFLGRMSLNGGLSAACSNEYNLYGADAGIQYEILKWLHAGGGLKYNYQTTYGIRQMGYSGNLRVTVPYVGEIGLMADKGFMPGAERRLVKNNAGRVTYTKHF